MAVRYSTKDQIAYELEQLKNEIIFYKSKQATEGLNMAEWWCLQNAKELARKLRSVRNG